MTTNTQSKTDQRKMLKRTVLAGAIAVGIIVALQAKLYLFPLYFLGQLLG
jgi:hypothetical protein